MGTWETDVYDAGPCPCGKGHIERIVDAPDNPWSRPHTSYRLACEDCAVGWNMSYDGTLTDRASEGAYQTALAESSKATNNLQEYLNSLLAQFNFPPFNRQIDEFEYLTKNGLYGGSIGQYRYARRAREMLDLAQVSTASAIVPSLVNTFGDITQYVAMVHKAKAASITAEVTDLRPWISSSFG